MVVQTKGCEMKIQNSITAASILNERARKFHLRVDWNLTDEFGPSHDRTFCVQLSLVCRGQAKPETFAGFGKSIKAARQAAASAAIENSLLLKDSVDRETRQPSNTDPEAVQCLTDFLHDVPHPMGPRAELYRLSKLFKCPLQFNRLSIPSESRVFSRYGSQIDRSAVYRVALSFAGRQYVSESTTRSTAEQEASYAALQALRQALLSVTTEKARNSTSKDIFYESSFPLDSATWKLRVIGHLHGERPIFALGSPSDFGRDKKQVVCTCTLKRWGTVEAVGRSLKQAREIAAAMMLDRLARGVSAMSEQSRISETKSSHKKLHKHPGRDKTKRRFACDRAEANYGQEINPISRLHFVCVAKQLPAPVFELNTNTGSTARSTQGSARAMPEFSYKVYLGTDCIAGPAAWNKRLAKRLAAEVGLTHLGFQHPQPSVLHSALRPSQSDASKDVSVIDTTGTELADSNKEPLSSSSVQKPDSAIANSDRSSNDRRVVFSCTRDVLIVEKDNVNPWKRPSRSTSRSSRDTNKNTGFSMSKPLKSSYGTNSAEQESTSETFSLALKNIGHWADSQEAQTVSRCIGLRRSNSCPRGDLDFGTQCQPLRTNSLQTLVGPTKPTTTGSNDYTEHPSNPALRLLSQVAAFCLLEHKTESNSVSNDVNAKRPTLQLTSLCQRLRIPCQFTDQKCRGEPLKQITRGELPPQVDRYLTVLTIGTYSSVNQYDTGGCGIVPIVVRGTGYTKEAAHDDAVLSAFRELARLNGALQSTNANKVSAG